MICGTGFQARTCQWETLFWLDYVVLILEEISVILESNGWSEFDEKRLTVDEW